MAEIFLSREWSDKALSELGHTSSDPRGVGKQRRDLFLPLGCPIKPSPRLSTGPRVRVKDGSPQLKGVEPLGRGPHVGPVLSGTWCEPQVGTLGHTEPHGELTPGLSSGPWGHPQGCCQPGAP